MQTTSTRDAPKGWYTDRTGKRFGRFPIGDKKRKSYLLETCTSDEAASARAKTLRSFADALLDAGRTEFVEKVLEEGAKLEDVESLRRIVAGIVKGTERKAVTSIVGVPTFRAIGEKWTSGELRRLYPDSVPAKKSADMDQSRLKKAYETLGDLAITEVRLEHAEEFMQSLSPDLSPATRRQYAQAVRRVLEFCVYPLRLIPSNPLPRGFLPKLQKTKALQWVYPSEDATLLAAPEAKVPLVYRLAYGVLHRVGFRKGELVGDEGYDDEAADDDDESLTPTPPMTWSMLDMKTGMLALDFNKTSDRRPIVLDAGTLRALKAWKEMHPNAKPSDVIFADETGQPIALAAATYRPHLQAAGVDRAELFATSSARRVIYLHDSRGSFTTVAIANGRSETWIRDRTGWTEEKQLDRYRRLARSFKEMSVGDWLPLDQAIPEFRGGDPADGPEDPTDGPPLDTPETPSEVGFDGASAGARETFDSSYEGSNPSVGTERGSQRLRPLLDASESTSAAASAAANAAAISGIAR